MIFLLSETSLLLKQRPTVESKIIHDEKDTLFCAWDAAAVCFC